MVTTGLESLKKNHSDIKGNVGYLCHAASIDSNYNHGIDVVKSIFGERLKKLFSPQHGIFADVQDNMVESGHFNHEYYGLPVYSLYSETRKPNRQMMEGLDHVLVDLQDVGTRVYTYIYTMTYMMEACAECGVEVIILDRPNPIGGEKIEGNILDLTYRSFVGRHVLPMRHGLTMGEVASMAKKHWDIDCELRVIKMESWTRDQFFWDTKLPWVLPSPNLPNPETAFSFVGTVLFEGTNISEGRGTTKSLETIGHPNIANYDLLNQLQKSFESAGLSGFILRPVSFMPTFQKHTGQVCHGYQIHVTDYTQFSPWHVGQIMCREFYHHLGRDFQWKQPPYEYEEELLPIDILNGTDKVRRWVESNGSMNELNSIETDGIAEYLDKRAEVLIY
ncbi:exo-beta-N-acetylmuramidase NamZ domain-containing protein [Reichenbachiella sp.]|uniref:exo-beta-N-acetylmuramidase NamZ family protein n=1 Tax=Reichenbachiella sp. TaxID=2184521 RepID=UPI003B5CE2F5